jgi:ATP-dependent DNA helicase RecQ
LVVEDVLTTGATTKDITRALSIAYPKARIYVFTLVKTLYRLQSGMGTVESQHNSILFADLYTARNSRKNTFANGTQLSQFNLVTKKFSANYAKTNHNFVFQNLKSFSISSEPDSKPILDAVYVLKNMLQRGKPTIASRRLRRAFGGEECLDGGGHFQALISQHPIQWQRLIRGNVRADKYPAKRFFDVLIPKHFGEYAFMRQLALPEVQIFDMTQVYVDRFNNRQVDFYIPQVGLIIEIDGPQHKETTEIDETRDAFTQSLGLKTVPEFNSLVQPVD